MPGWTDASTLHPYAVYVLVREREPLPGHEIAARALQRAAAKGAAHWWGHVPQGMAALEAYLADVADPARDFAATPEWFCWAAFERLMARKCCAVWLRRASAVLGGRAAKHALAAADRYEAAFQHYEAYRACIGAGEPSGTGFQERARAPERIAEACVPLRQGLDALTRAAAGVSASR
ncbi:MAG: hypothetical protein HY320_00660 [Armatimonadetes bacterium]|nr:hypothetical protein [Armatimonadota bacterium]